MFLRRIISTIYLLFPVIVPTLIVRNLRLASFFNRSRLFCGSPGPLLVLLRRWHNASLTGYALALSTFRKLCGICFLLPTGFTAGWHQTPTVPFYPGLRPADVWTGLSALRQRVDNIYIYDMGICLEKCHFGFSKSSKFKRVVLLICSKYCHTKSRLNKEKLSVGGSFKK